MWSLKRQIGRYLNWVLVYICNFNFKCNLIIIFFLSHLTWLDMGWYGLIQLDMVWYGLCHLIIMLVFRAPSVFIIPSTVTLVGYCQWWSHSFIQSQIIVLDSCSLANYWNLRQGTPSSSSSYLLNVGLQNMSNPIKRIKFNLGKNEPVQNQIPTKTKIITSNWPTTKKPTKHPHGNYLGHDPHRPIWGSRLTPSLPNVWIRHCHHVTCNVQCHAKYNSVTVTL